MTNAEISKYLELAMILVLQGTKIYEAAKQPGATKEQVRAAMDEFYSERARVQAIIDGLPETE